MKVLLQLLIISQIVLLGACSSSTKMRDTWHADNFHPEKFDNVLVVGQTTNTSTRLIWESSYAHELETYGITAILWLTWSQH